MRIKRTFAPTMREALLLVKQDQGADAVILGNKKVSGGVEILSAIDFDEAAINGAQRETHPAVPRQQQAALAARPVIAGSDVASDAWSGSLMQDGRREPVLGPVAGASSVAPAASELAGMSANFEQLLARLPAARGAAPAQPVAAAAPPRQSATRVAPAPAGRVPARTSTGAGASRQARSPKQPAVRPADRPADRPANKASRQPVGKGGPATATREAVAIGEVKIELQNLRDLMESQLSVMQWDRYSEKHPVRSLLLKLMSDMGLGTDICDDILSRIERVGTDPQKVWQQALAVLARRLPIDRRDLMAEGGRIALVGSTGVGKTTTIAKIAARFAHSHGKRSVAMVSTDQFRIGAQEQLQHFARLIEVPLLMASNGEELCDRLDMLADKKLVLIDTAGMSQRDMRLAEQFQRLQASAPTIEPYLVLSANTQLAALNQTVRNFSRVPLAGAIVTKLDEAASLGGILTTAVRHALPLAYCGTGQQVPRDLEPAKAGRLVGRAVKLMQQYSEHLEQSALASRYQHIITKNPA